MNKRISIAAAALTVVAGSVAPLGNVFAASKAPTWTDNISSATISRKLQNAYGHVNNTFTYTITANSNNPAGATGAPTSASIAFDENYATQGDVAKTTTVDFSGMQFERVGDYNFTVAETSSSNASVYPVDSTNTYTATVVVRNNSDLTGYVASLYIRDKDGNKLDSISGDTTDFVYTSAPVYTNIQASATASGNAADPDKCFEYTVNFDTQDSYKVNTSSTCTNPETIADGGKISLKSGDTVTIGVDGTKSQIPVGTAYAITKEDTTDGYTVKMDGQNQNVVEKTAVATNSSDFNTNNKTTIDEGLNSAVVTGAAMNIAIYILLAIAGTTGVYVATKKKAVKE